MPLVSAIVLIAVLTVMFVAARDFIYAEWLRRLDVRLSRQNRAANADPQHRPAQLNGFPLFVRLTTTGSAILWVALNLISSLILVSLLVDSPALTFLHSDSGIGVVVGMLALFVVIVVIVINVARFDLAWRLWRVTLLAIAFWLALILISSIVLPHAVGDGGGIIQFVQRPGTLFVAVLGLVTTLGFLVTISQLREMNARITDYPTLLKRLTFLINESIERRTRRQRWPLFYRVGRAFDRFRWGEIDSPDRVWIYVRTLALGSMSVEHMVYKRYAQAVNELLCNGAWIVLQHDHWDLPALVPGQSAEDGIRGLNGHARRAVVKLYLYFRKRGFGPDQVMRGYSNASELGRLAHLQGTPFATCAPNQPWPERVVCCRPPGVALPTHHLFVSDQRAIVVTALDLPVDGDTLRLPRDGPHGNVHVVAIETTNFGVIARLRRTFEEILDECREGCKLCVKEYESCRGAPESKRF